MQSQPRRFTVIGENIHVTRSVSRKSPRIVETAGGAGIEFVGLDGQDAVMPLVSPITGGTEFAQGKVQHLRNALLLGLAGDEIVGPTLARSVDAAAAQIGRDYLVAAALRQEAAGADYLDVNVDEIADDSALRAVAMAWLARLLEPVTSDSPTEGDPRMTTAPR